MTQPMASLSLPLVAVNSTTISNRDETAVLTLTGCGRDLSEAPKTGKDSAGAAQVTRSGPPQSGRP